MFLLLLEVAVCGCLPPGGPSKSEVCDWKGFLSRFIKLDQAMSTALVNPVSSLKGISWKVGIGVLST